MKKHQFPWENEAVRIVVVGCGGTGSQMLTGLCRMDVSMRALGHPGLHIHVYDPDIVTEFNVGRQLYSSTDIGRNKAATLATRLNAFYGTCIQAWSFAFSKEASAPVGNTNVVIGCVDTRAARRDIWRYSHATYWLDIGNTEHTAQVILGHLACGSEERLPNAAELFSEIIDPKKDRNTRPSCSMAGALSRQDLFVNQAAATFALNLLWRWYRNGLDYHGGFINLETGMTTPLWIHEEEWRRLGYFNGPGVMRRIIRYNIKPGPGFYAYGRAKLECGHLAWTKSKHRTRCKVCQS